MKGKTGHDLGYLVDKVSMARLWVALARFFSALTGALHPLRQSVTTNAVLNHG